MALQGPQASPEEEHAVGAPVFMPVFACGRGRKWRAGSLLYSQTAPSVSHICLCGHGGVFKLVCCPPADASASHQCGSHKDFSVWSTVGVWRQVFVAGEGVGVEPTFNDLIVQSGAIGFLSNPSGVDVQVQWPPQWHSLHYSNFMGCSKHYYYSKAEFWTSCFTILTPKPHFTVQQGNCKRKELYLHDDDCWIRESEHWWWIRRQRSLNRSACENAPCAPHRPHRVTVHVCERVWTSRMLQAWKNWRTHKTNADIKLESNQTQLQISHFQNKNAVKPPKAPLVLFEKHGDHCKVGANCRIPSIHPSAVICVTLTAASCNHMMELHRQTLYPIKTGQRFTVYCHCCVFLCCEAT